MALIDCAACGKRISNKLDVCHFCGCSTFDTESTETVRSLRISRRKFVARMEMAAYAAVTIVTGGAWWYWEDTHGLLDPVSAGPLITIGAGTGSFLLMRLYAMYYNSKVRKRNKD